MRMRMIYMSTNTIEIYRRGSESSEKFDYFVCGIAGALFAYIAKNYSPDNFRHLVSFLELVALFSLAVSFYFGLKRLEMFNAITHINHDLVSLEEKAVSIVKALRERPESYLDLTGQVYDRKTLETMHQDTLKNREKIAALLPEAVSRSKKYYNRRDTLLIFGFASIVLAKIFEFVQWFL
jgi:hypothetical protein